MFFVRSCYTFKTFVADFSASPNAAPACRKNVSRRLEQSASYLILCLFKRQIVGTGAYLLVLALQALPSRWRNIL